MKAKHWEKTTLGSIVSFEYGASLTDEQRIGVDFPVYGSNGEVGRHKNCLVRGPGIVVGRKGTVGAVTWSKEPFWPIDTTYYVRSKYHINLRWCYWLLRALPLERLDSSTGVPGLNRNDAYVFPVFLPPVPEQKGIAAILDTIDTAIQQTEALIEKLKQMKAGLLHDLLTRGLDENGLLRDPATHPEQFKDSPLGRIPKNWEAIDIGAVISKGGGFIQTGPFGSQLHADEYVESGMPVVMPQDILNGSFNDRRIARISQEKAMTLARHRMKPNDVVFARRGDLSRSAPVGVRETDWLCGTGCLLVRAPREQIDGKWLSYVYQHDWSQRQILARAVGTTMVNLNTKLLSLLIIAKPSIHEQDAIVQIVDRCEFRIRAEETYCDKLKQLKRGLMDDLLTGKVRVNVKDKVRS